MAMTDRVVAEFIYSLARPQQFVIRKGHQVSLEVEGTAEAKWPWACADWLVAEVPESPGHYYIKAREDDTVLALDGTWDLVLKRLERGETCAEAEWLLPVVVGRHTRPPFLQACLRESDYLSGLTPGSGKDGTWLLDVFVEEASCRERLQNFFFPSFFLGVEEKEVVCQFFEDGQEDLCMWRETEVDAISSIMLEAV
ncbi:unnamed protein product [Symbiodinium microadriaticum]|nr:unnamed protein product [Symbiodinium microadriaticum]